MMAGIRENYGRPDGKDDLQYVFSIAEERPDDHGTQSRPMESANCMRVELNSLIDEGSITLVRCFFLQ